MSNNINYINHATYEAPYYQRRFENDLPETSSDWIEKGKRIALLALPFLSLWKSLGQAISAVMGSVRCITHLCEAISLRHELKASLGKIAKLALAAMALAGTIYSFQLGICISTGADLSLGLAHGLEHLISGNWSASLEEMLGALSSFFYLGILLTGSLELILLSILLQAAINLYQGISEYKKGRWPEFIAKLVMTIIRFRQATHYIELINRRDFLLSMEKFSKLAQQIKKGREASHLIDSPLDQKASEVVLVDAEGNSYDFGTHFHGYGKGSVKGMNLQFRTTIVDGKNVKELDFKVNHVFRDRLSALLKEIARFDPHELEEFLSLTHSHAKGIKIESQILKFSSDERSPSYGTLCKITLVGLGSLSIGNNSDFPNLYDRVTVEVDEDKNLYELHELLSFFNLDDALRVSGEEDIMRLKMGQLFRIFHPKEATFFEREDAFYSLPIEELRSEMVKKAPEMQQTFDRYLSKMEAREILPGRMRYAVTGFADKLYELGARGLVATITGSGDQSFDRTVSILKMGMLSPETRYAHGIHLHGLSPEIDFYSGGADSVYTQLLTERNIKDKMDLDKLYWGDVRLLLSLELLETGTYQYHEDRCGVRRIIDAEWHQKALELIQRMGLRESQHDEMILFLKKFYELYPNRPNIETFVQEEQERGFAPGNEVMVKERIPPSMIKGLIVPNEEVKNDLVATLRNRDLIVLDPNGKETILGNPIEKFIHIGTHLSEDFFSIA